MNRRSDACRAVVLAAALAGLLTLPARPALGQTPQFDVRGVVTDSAGMAVQGAMAVALALPDSVLTTFSLTDGDGAFRLQRVPTGRYVLQVTMVGFQTSRTDFSVADGDLAADTVRLSVLAVDMDPLVVSVEHVPFISKGDTLSFNVLAFPTPPNAAVEDLLRRLPGFEVEADGSIRAMGVDVENVLVDGKEFFGSDPTIATRNLPADALERVEVYDKESDLAEFTGVPDGEEERTVDLTLREEARRGSFGQVFGALGADQGAEFSLASRADEGVRYSHSFNLNRFSPNNQIAVLGSADNTNRAGFSGSNLQVLAPAAEQEGGGRDGFAESLSLGANVGHDFGGESWIRTSYFLGRVDRLQSGTTQREQLLGSQVASSSDEMSDQTSENLAHTLNLNAQHTIADGHQVRLRGTFNKSSSSRTTNGSEETRTPAGGILHTAATQYLQDSDNLGANAALTWRKRLDDSGRTLVAELTANLNEPDQTADLASTTGAPEQGDVLTYEEVVQVQQSGGRTLGQTQRLSLTQPLGPGRLLEIFGQRRSVDEDQSKSVYDLAGGGAPVFNEALSSEFERTYTYLRGGLRFNRTTGSTLLLAGLEVQGSDLDGTVIDEDERITKAFTHVLPNARLRYTWRPGWSLDLLYSTSTREPTLQELQPFTDNSNPTRVYVGNPDLEPAYRHNLSVEYRHFDQFSFTNLRAYVRGSYVNDDIVQSRNVDGQGLQVVKPVNSGSGWTTSLGANYDTPVRRIGAKINVAYDLVHARSTELLNGAGNESRITRHSLRTRLENRQKDVFDLAAGATITLNRVGYSLNPELDQSYVNSTLDADVTWYYGTNWTFGSSLDYRLFDEDVFGPARNIALLNVTISRYIADRRGEIQLSAYDLLDQNQGVTFNSTSSAITESRVQSLRQYVMLRVVWRLGMRAGGLVRP